MREVHRFQICVIEPVILVKNEGSNPPLVLEDCNLMLVIFVHSSFLLIFVFAYDLFSWS